MEQQGYFINSDNNSNGTLSDGKHYNAALYMRFSRDDGATTNSVLYKTNNE